MATASEAAIGFEAVKVSMSQTKDGMKITLVIHPQDGINDLFSHPVGSRYQVALVLLDDENQPVVPAQRTDAQRAVVAAAMLCRESSFQQWMEATSKALSATEDDAVHGLCHACGIQSRAELATNEKARSLFAKLRNEFGKSQGGFP